MNGASDHTPNPDPTLLTTEALLREIEHLRELLQSKLDGHAEFSARRYDDLDTLMAQRVEGVERLFQLHLDEARQQLLDQIEASRRAADAALTATTTAITKAEQATEKRFDAVNAFRDQLSDQSQTFLRRDLFDQHVREARESLGLLQVRVENNAAQLLTLTASETGGRDREAQARANLASIAAGVATLVAVATLILSLLQ